MDARLAELAQTVDLTEFGRRVRTLRMAAGLKQSDLAGHEVTGAYISRIEAGQRRPTKQVLELLAERLSVSLEHLLLGPAADVVDEPVLSTAERLELDHAELSLMSGDAVGALRQIEGLLPGLTEAGTTAGVRRAQQLRAGALEATGDTTGAIRLLETITADVSPDVQWIQSVMALSRCYRETGEFSRAIASGERAVEHLADLGLAETTEAVQLTVTVAGAYMERGDLDHALRLCLAGVEQGERIASPIGQGSAYWNASVVETMRGNQQSALELAQRALAYFQIGHDSRNLGRLRTQIAILQLRQSPPNAEAARETLSQAERELSWSAANAFDRASHYLASAKARLLLGDLEAAERDISQSREAAVEEAPLLLAESHLLTGQICAARNRLELAREWYQRAVATLTGIGSDREVTRLWFDLAAVLENSGDAAGALDAYKRGATATGLASADQVARTLSISSEADRH